MLPVNRTLLEVKIPSGIMPINMTRIVFIEAEKKYSIIYYDNQKDEALQFIETYHQLKWFHNFLDAPIFFRCHKSFIINCFFIKCYNHKEITLSKRTKVPLSRNAMKRFKENMDHLFRSQDLKNN